MPEYEIQISDATPIMPVYILKEAIHKLQTALFTNINYMDGWSEEFREFLEEAESLQDDLYCTEMFLEEIHDTLQVYIKDIEFILNGNFTYPALDDEDINRQGIPVESYAIYSFLNMPGLSMDVDAVHFALKSASDIWVVLNLSLLQLYELDRDIHAFKDREYPEYFLELEDIIE